ncbi:MAG: bifunctional diaminohydroxyphosphoribosylaminopyrimidine deaminase/5-amino-6-(5-phosphoribosylamino)uracil reductase RibD [Lautropia sp.]|nr:bifunctional diaminohydroxyphosphoribosylaminopyrimidine deaminase/5-amino-6-(5-phosphoribosylamino)uracil reductase RibD [Lautropia sp.]
MYGEADRQAMERAIALARQGLYTTTPNPRVGCVIVRDGEVVGEGWHRRAGEPHAEVLALAEAGGRARGATAYVTLEPCSHQGKTPPCCDRLIEAGVARVIAAMEDPNPLVNGQGLTRLRDAGIDVRCGLMAEEAAALNVGFISRMTRGRPWVRLKVATSLDGFIALPDGESQWITGQQARADGHGWRAQACAILTGSGTVRADDPSLTVRHVDTSRQPVRVLIDSQLAVDPGAAIFGPGEVWVIHARPEDEDDPRQQALRLQGARLLSLPVGEHPGARTPGVRRRVDLPAALRALGAAGFNELHVEAGAGLNAALMAAGCVDELLLYLAPAMLGAGLPAFALPAVDGLARRIRLDWLDVTPVGEDLRLRLRVLGTEADERPAIRPVSA